MAEARSTFGPVVLLGLATAGLAAVAGTKPWLDVEPPGGDCAPVPGVDYGSFALDAPLAGALALVLLAAWGVLLVTRGRFRQAIAGLALVASAGYLATAIEAYWSLKDSAEAAVLEAAGAPQATCPSASIWMNNTWWLLALAAGVLSVLAALAAIRWVRGWPEMGSRYDAPTGESGTDDAPPETNIDIWKALDEGRDPTA